MTAEAPFILSRLTSASSEMVVHDEPWSFSPKDCTQAKREIRNSVQYFLYLGQFYAIVREENKENKNEINEKLIIVLRTRGSAGELEG